MNMIDQAFGVHEQALGLRSQRMEVLARNIANADTPHFKAQDLDFKTMLKSAQQTALGTTHSSHLPTDLTEQQNGLMYRVPFNVAFDGNTVELAVEQAKYGQSAADYQATLSILENRISGIRKALRGD
ncbi:MAG: flagellar basal body rod protein FlgB [Comamonadaceae bacterium]|nr:MAG: flagellar basal body rod protein FlgB [Comamonadaceae bacterium]